MKFCPDNVIRRKKRPADEFDERLPTNNGGRTADTSVVGFPRDFEVVDDDGKPIKPADQKLPLLQPRKKNQ